MRGDSMCGRYLLSHDLKSLIEILQNRWDIKKPNIDYYEPDYNIAPGQNVLAIYHDTGNDYSLSQFLWGYLPHWSKDLSKKMINARSESIDKKPYFKDSFHKRKCLILASGFYEWKRDKSKSPYFVGIKENDLFSFAGIWDFHPQQSDLKTCAILTTAANEIITPIHNRMPVILDEEGEKSWLTADRSNYIDIFKPYSSGKMKIHEVSNYVNNWRNNDKQCIKPLIAEQLKF